MRNRLLTLLTVIATSVALAAGSAAPLALADDSAAVAVNTRDDSTLFKIVFDIRRVMGDTVDQSNAAAAVSSCDSCETVAIAIQVVLAAGNPSVVVPENLALAMNIDCNLCQSLADAYQYVYTGTGVVHFTPDGNRRIAEIRRQLEQLRTSGLPIEEIATRVDQLNTDLQQVLLTEIVPAGPPRDQPASDTGTSTTPTDTGTSTTPSDTGTSTGTQTTPTDTGTQTTPTDTGTSTTPSDTTTETTPTDTGTQTTTGTSTTPTG
ncbi:MAG: putative peptide zinc metalloprotease protein [Frankiaceae bacterium]|nr:putative peptide zinc metalloprotease protein [Frankiaceae bacterium]